MLQPSPAYTPWIYNQCWSPKGILGWIIKNLLLEKQDYEVTIRQAVFIGICLLSSGAAFVFSQVYCILSGFLMAGITSLLIIVIHSLGLCALHRRRDLFEMYCAMMIAMYLFIPVIVHAVFGGSSGIQLWTVFAPIGAFFLRVHWRSTVMGVFVGCMGFQFLIDLLQPALGFVPEKTAQRIWLEYANFLCSSSLLVFVIAYYAQKLNAEKVRGDTLLDNTFPPSVVRRLKQGEETIVEDVECATILFADIVGFSTIADSMDAPSVVAMLNTFFSALDELSQKYGVEKIKTIGDAYMVGANISKPNSNHAEALASLSLAMLQTSKMVSAKLDQEIRLRIGIASGPVVAGIIGLQNRTFDVYGSTVNLASRMESSGLPDCVQLCEMTAKLLEGSTFAVRERGTIHVKGLGTRRTFWLLDSKVNIPFGSPHCSPSLNRIGTPDQTREYPRIRTQLSY